MAVAVVLLVIIGIGLTVRVSDWVPVPATLLAERMRVRVAAVVGVPEITPVSGLKLRPVGRPVAAKRVVALSVVMT